MAYSHWDAEPTTEPDDPDGGLGLLRNGGGDRHATAFYGGGDPNYVFTLTDYYTWGVAMVDGAPQRVAGTGGTCLSDATASCGSRTWAPTGTPHRFPAERHCE